ncbi:MAG: AbrB/MazE/SpoVT family DNA-binding domain-containing protein [Hyphomicrobiaceae bacterium]|nr:AbrB/MazE/SpoVT family DNA-binding domain-containing protein [Hyphomicrobiaceae bacterium]
MKKLKVRKIGNSLGVVLPKELLAELEVGEGDELVATRAQDGILVGSRSKKFERTMEIAEKFMKKYRNTLRELAK